ncbi:MAG: amidohydrolase family protein [Clostridia bacterium]|nr:amidohydrolase family protein [Clostridia bacterium]
MVRFMSYRPAELLKLTTRGQIKEGYIADLTVFNPNDEYTYTEDMIVSKSKNSPWIGKKLTGRVKYTVVGGRVVYSY